MYIYFFSKLNIIKIKNLETSSKSNISKSHFRGGQETFEQKTLQQKTLQQTCSRCFHDAFFFTDSQVFCASSFLFHFMVFLHLLFSLLNNQISIQRDFSVCWVFSFSMCIVCYVKRIWCEQHVGSVSLHEMCILGNILGKCMRGQNRVK